MKFHFKSLVTLLVVIFTACSPATFTSGNDSPTTPAQQDTNATLPGNPAGDQVSPINTLDSSETTPPPPEANPFVKLAEEDLANRLGISTGQINFLKLSDIDWQDVRQGCTGSPGQVLTKGRVTGYRIWLAASGRNYLYHIGMDNTIFLCPD